MKKADFESLIKTLKEGDKLNILYRSNWRGGDGRPHDHRHGKLVGGTFDQIEREGIKIREMEFPINYKALKEVNKRLKTDAKR